MTGFKPWTSGIGTDRSTNWANHCPYFFIFTSPLEGGMFNWQVFRFKIIPEIIKGTGISF